MPFFLCILSFLFAFPSICYIIKNKSIYHFIEMWTCLFKIPATPVSKLTNAIFYFVLLSAMFICYYFLIKKANDYFKTKGKLALCIGITSLLFTIIIPYTSSDVYSYIAHGWSNSHYGANPYYESIEDVVQEKQQSQDKMFHKVANCWRGETVVYGPLWTLICRMISGVSTGNIDIALIIFKLVNLLVHFVICSLIWKCTKRKVFVVLYGLNPFILFETLSNVHNDSFVILFCVLAIYMVLKKRNIILATAFIAMATGIKYFAVLLAPFLVLYFVRRKPLYKKIQYSILCGIEFLLILFLFYAVYVRDINVLAGLFIQQNKYNKSIYHLIYQFIGNDTPLLSIVKNGTLILFAIYYIIKILSYFKNPKQTFSSYMRTYQVMIFIFTFILITNFNPWYILWLFPTVFWNNSKGITFVISVSYASLIAQLHYFALWSEEQKLGILYFFIMLFMTVLLYNIERKGKLIKISSNGG